MSGIFGGGEAKKGQAAQTKATKKYANQLKDLADRNRSDVQEAAAKIGPAVTAAQGAVTTGIGDERARLAASLAAQLGLIGDERARLGDFYNSATSGMTGINPVNYAGPGYGINIGANGNINVSRNADTQGWIDRLLSGTATDEAAYTENLGRVTPGFGELTNSRLTDVENKRYSDIGNLREQLAKRRVLGASFADNEIANRELMWQQERDKVIAESKIAEIEMTTNLIKQRSDTRLANVTQGLQQIQFEGNLGNELTQGVMQVFDHLKTMQVDIAKLFATLSTGLTELGVNATGDAAARNVDLTKLGTLTNAELAQLGITAPLDAARIASGTAGQLISSTGGLQSTTLGSYPAFAELASQEAAGPFNLIGQLLGLGLTGGASGGSGLLSNIFSGGLMTPTTTATPLK